MDKPTMTFHSMIMAASRTLCVPHVFMIRDDRVKSDKQILVVYFSTGHSADTDIHLGDLDCRRAIRGLAAAKRLQGDVRGSLLAALEFDHR